jgi:hypothetical protein
MTEKKTKMAQGTGVAAIVLALAGAMGNYYQAQAVKASAVANTKKVAKAMGPEVNLLIKRVDRLEDRLFRLEGQALGHMGPPAPAPRVAAVPRTAPTSSPQPRPVVAAVERGPEPDVEAAAIMDEPDVLEEAPEDGYEAFPDDGGKPPEPAAQMQRPIDMDSLLEKL